MPSSQVFATLARIASQSEQDVESAWFGIQEKTIRESLLSLIQKENISSIQLKTLQATFNNIIEHKGKNWLGDLFSVLSTQQQSNFIKNLAGSFINNLDAYFAELNKHFTLDQKQVIKAYIQNSYAGK